GSVATGAVAARFIAVVVFIDAAVDDVAHAQHIVRREVAALARRVDHPTRDVRRAIDEITRPCDGQRIAAQGDAHASQAGQLDQIGVVHAGQREWIGPFRGDSLRDGIVTHVASPDFSTVTLMCKSLRSSEGTTDGAPSNNARAAVVLGNAMTSRSEPALASCMAMRSNPNAMPPCGGAPAR